MDVLVKFTHGLGDATQLTCVLRHLAIYRPQWVVDVASQVGKHSAFFGLCRRSYILGREAIDESGYTHIFDLGWYECYSVYADSPCTKICNCLREVFGIVPDLSLLRYRIGVSDASRERTREYLTSICNGHIGDPAAERLPVVAIHYQSNTSNWKKDLPHPLIANLCRGIQSRGHVPLILDWDRRSPLPDQKSIFCPGVGSGDLWDNTGTGDAERLAALLSQCALVVGIDSGPLHVAGATETPTVGIWTGHHPVQFYDLCPNVTHLVPEQWRTIPPCQNAPAAQFFTNHYAYRTYSDLERTLIPTVAELLQQDTVRSTAPAGSSPKPYPSPPSSFVSSPQETSMTPTITAPTWIQVPGLAREIAAGADGSVWCLSPGEISPSGYSIHHWNGSDWDHVAGAATKIAVSPNGEPWVVDRDHRISRLTPSGWDVLPGLAREIAIGSHWSVCCLSPADYAPGGASIHYWNGIDWDHVEGAAVKIAVTPTGEPWIVNSAHQIFRRCGEGWELLPGLAHEIAIGSDGTVWCLGTGDMPGGEGFSIHRWNGVDWDHMPGAARKIAAGPAAALWVLHSDHLIFRASC